MKNAAITAAILIVYASGYIDGGTHPSIAVKTPNTTIGAE
jgi:hypothetical protein